MIFYSYEYKDEKERKEALSFDRSDQGGKWMEGQSQQQFARAPLENF